MSSPAEGKYVLHAWTSRTQTVLRAARAGDFRALRAVVERGLFPASIFRRNRLVIASLHKPQPPAHYVEGFRLRWASRRDIAALTLVRNRPEDFREFFSRGYVCLLGEVAGEPATFSWLELDQDHVSRPNGYHFALGEGAAWAFGLEVRPGYEREGLFHRHWYRKMNLLRTGGVDRVFIAFQDDCPASRLQHARVGFRPEYSVGVLRVLGAILHRGGSLLGDPPAAGVRLGRWRGDSGQITAS